MHRINRIRLEFKVYEKVYMKDDVDTVLIESDWNLKELRISVTLPRKIPY